MSQELIRQTAADKTERIHMPTRFFHRSRFLAAFLICGALFIAAFAVSAIWAERGGVPWNNGDATVPPPLDDGEGDAQPPAPERPSDTTDAPAIEIPTGATPVLDADLSASSFGAYYVNNETIYSPNVQELLQTDLSCEVSEAPLVLILHTHTSESYLTEGTPYVEGEVGDLTYTRDNAQNVVAVGEVLADTLNKNGITAIHCTVMHDMPTLAGSYTRAAESIRFYLEQYPTIRYVIDLHRDAVLNADGAYLRAVCQKEDGERVAQVMAVVGSDGGGEAHPQWERNLALALQLRAHLNGTLEGVCRPPMLKNATYNQELSPYSILLEIGTGGNSLAEAERAAVMVGEALATVLKGQ